MFFDMTEALLIYLNGTYGYYNSSIVSFFLTCYDTLFTMWMFTSLVICSS